MEAGFNTAPLNSLENSRRYSDGPTTLTPVKIKREKYKGFKKVFSSLSHFFVKLKPKNNNNENSLQVKVNTASESGKGAQEIFNQIIKPEFTIPLHDLPDDQASPSYHQEEEFKETPHSRDDTSKSVERETELILTTKEKIMTPRSVDSEFSSIESVDSTQKLKIPSKGKLVAYEASSQGSKSSQSENILERVANINSELTHDEQLQKKKLERFVFLKQTKQYDSLAELMRQDPLLFTLLNITSKKNFNDVSVQTLSNLSSAIAFTYKHLGITTKQLFLNTVFFLKIHQGGPDKLQNFLLNIIVEWFYHGLNISELQDVREELQALDQLLPNHPKVEEIRELSQGSGGEKLTNYELPNNFFNHFKKQIKDDFKKFRKVIHEKIKFTSNEDISDEDKLKEIAKMKYVETLQNSIHHIKAGLQSILFATPFSEIPGQGITDFKNMISSILDSKEKAKQEKIIEYFLEISLHCFNHSDDATAYTLFKSIDASSYKLIRSKPKKYTDDHFIIKSRKLLMELETDQADLFTSASIVAFDLLSKEDLIDDSEGIPVVNMGVIFKYEKLLKDYLSKKSEFDSQSLNTENDD